jgi:ribosomal protein L11 methyltransferase
MSIQIELRAIVPAELADELEAYFFETETIYWGIMQKERGDPYEVFGFFPDETTADSELKILREAYPALPEDFELGSMEDSYWQNAYKEYVKPWSDRQLHWIPLWERENCIPPSGAAVVYLEAGMAFGTGSHETTRLCARRLLDYYEANKASAETKVLVDAGCGSGVLALSAAAIGFKKVSGFDYDPEAITVCDNNTNENPHLPRLPFKVADLNSGLVPAEADLLLANIQTNVLIPDSDALLQALRAGGTLALSGILTSEIDTVREHFSARCSIIHGPGFKIDSRVDGEWADLCIQI